MAKINPQYRKQIEQIKVEGEEYADSEMKPVYTQQKKALDTLHTFVGALYISYAKDGLLKMTDAQKASTMASIKTMLKTMGKDLGDAEVAKVTDILGKTYEDSYYKNAYLLNGGGGKK
jgi:hypothetical protein